MTRVISTAATVLFVAAGMTGCATTESGQTATNATHYWESTAPTKKYNADHESCEQKTEVDADGELNANSASFDAYRDCMIGQGYTLRTY